MVLSPCIQCTPEDSCRVHDVFLDSPCGCGNSCHAYRVFLSSFSFFARKGNTLNSALEAVCGNEQLKVTLIQLSPTWTMTLCTLHHWLCWLKSIGIEVQNIWRALNWRMLI